MALDDVLTRRVQLGHRGPTLRFWEWSSPAAILGRFQSVRAEVYARAAEQAGVAVVRRVSGGGTMYVEPEHTITYSLYVPPELVAGLSFIDSYAFLDAWAVWALRELGIEVWYEPVNSMMSRHGKLAGAAQLRRQGVVLHHTTMAYDMDQDRLQRVLCLGRRPGNERAVASVVRPVGPLRMQTDLSRSAVIERLIDHFVGCYGGVEDTITADEHALAAELVGTKFSQPEWIYAVP